MKKWKEQKVKSEHPCDALNYDLFAYDNVILCLLRSGPAWQQIVELWSKWTIK